MASDIAPTPQLTNGDAADAHQSTVNGNHMNQVESEHVTDSQIPQPPSKVQSETSLNLKESTSTIMDPPTESTPLENTSSGFQPVADFLPKDSSNLSHPTPPPDEPLTTGAADIDVEMGNASNFPPPVVDAPPQSSLPEPIVAPAPPASETVAAASEPSLVRPREDDEMEEPAAKRSRVEREIRGDLPILPVSAPAVSDAPAPSALVCDALVSETKTVDAPVIQKSVTDEPVAGAPLVDAPISDVRAADAPIADVTLPDAPSAGDSESAVVSAAESQVEAAAEPAVDSITQSIAEPAPAVGTEVNAQPSASDIKAEAASVPAVSAVDESKDVLTGTAEVAAKRSVDEKPNEVSAPNVESQPAAAPAAVALQTSAAPGATPAATSQPPKYDTRDLTAAQFRFLAEKMKNLKKTKSSFPFTKPVDPIALNIPNYTDFIKNPMDLGTMETKLKENKYTSVQDFVNDFELIINNTRAFNGEAHPVTIAGMNMDAYFRRMMENVPSADIPAAPPKAAKKRSPSVPREARRQSRNPAPPAPATAAPSAGSPRAPATTYALNNDGTPQLRRDSNRPQRAIKPPQNREITYAKPRRKEHQLELRFCEHVLDEVRSAKYGTLNHVFMLPVDPVALNIPHYRQVIKNPMDLSTMSTKLKNGQYTTASEFKKDFELMVKNCLTFNPIGNPVHDIGVKFQREFDALWAEKSKWERQNQPASNRASSASVVGEDSADEEEEDSDAEGDEKEATIRALQKQLAEVQNALSGLGAGGKVTKSKKSKPSKSGSKKSGATTVVVKAKAASKPKKPRQVTYEEKQEISEAVGRMSEQQVSRLTQIITSNCEKYRDMDEMELEIDDLPNDVQLKLLDYVRSIFGKPKKLVVRDPSPDDAAAIDDDDFEPESRARGGAGAGGKRKKHKPMGKKEQTDTIRSLQDKLAQFSNVATSGSESPTNSSFHLANNAQADESSGDEESEESEEE